MAGVSFASCIATPESHLADLIRDLTRAAANAESEAEAMTILRALKAEAALLVALCDIGGVWGVERVTAALTELAESGVQSALRFQFNQEIARGRIAPPDAAHPERGSGLIVLAMGKMGAGELNYSSDIDLIVFFDREANSLNSDIEPQPFFVRVTQGVARILQQRHRRRLRVPRRSAVAARSRFDRGCDLDRGGARLLRARGPHLGACGDDQGAALRRRHRGGQRAGRRLAPFVWRRHLDFAALADIHDMKRQMHAYRGTARSRSRAITSSSAAVASARSSFSPRPSN